jgi:hypothetical protein
MTGSVTLVMTAANNRYSYLRVAVIWIDVHPAGETRPTHHMHSTLSLHMTRPYVSHTVNAWQPYAKSSIYLYRSTTPEKKGSRHNPQLDGRLICGSIPSFFPTIANEAVGKRQVSIDNQLLGLPGPYHRHAIGTFNTCSRGPTHRSLTDMGRGYSLKGVGFSRTTP